MDTIVNYCETIKDAGYATPTVRNIANRIEWEDSKGLTDVKLKLFNDFLNETGWEVDCEIPEFEKNDRPDARQFKEDIIDILDIVDKSHKVHGSNYDPQGDSKLKLIKNILEPISTGSIEYQLKIYTIIYQKVGYLHGVM